MDDQQIIELHWKRSEAAVLQTLKQYGGYCRRISLNILGNIQDADECVNDACMHAWSAIPPNRPEVFRIWLGKVTRNLSLDRHKKGKAQKRGGGSAELLFSELEECIPGHSGPEKQLEDAEIANQISVFLRGRAQESRTIFLRRYYYGDSIRDIAERMDVSESKVKTSLLRTRRALKAELEKEGVRL